MKSNRRLIFSATTDSDLRELIRYSLETCSESQARAYASQLMDGADSILRFPGLGIRQESLGKGVRAFAIGQHVLLYREINDAIIITRIVHKRIGAQDDLDGPSYTHTSKTAEHFHTLFKLQLTNFGCRDALNKASRRCWPPSLPRYRFCSFR